MKKLIVLICIFSFITNVCFAHENSYKKHNDNFLDTISKEDYNYLKSIRSEKLVFGITEEYLYKNNISSRYDKIVEILENVFKLKIEIKFLDWRDGFELLKSEADLLTNVIINPDKSNEVYYIEDGNYSNLLIITRKDSGINDLEHIYGKKIGYENNTNHSEFLDYLLKNNYQKMNFNNLNDMIQSLDNKDIDAAIMESNDRIIISKYMNLNIAFPINSTIIRTGICTNDKKYKRLTELVNNYINLNYTDELKNVHNSEDDLFKYEFIKSLSNEERNYIHNNNVIEVFMSKYSYPFSYQYKNNHFGIADEILTLYSYLTNSHIEYIDNYYYNNNKNVIEDLKKNKIQLTDIDTNINELDGIHISENIIKSPLVVVAHKNNQNYQDVTLNYYKDYMANSKFGVLKSLDNLVDFNQSDYKYYLYETQDNLIKALKRKEIDYIIVTQDILDYYNTINKNNDLMKVYGFDVIMQKRFAYNKDNIILNNILDKVIHIYKIKDYDYENRWNNNRVNYQHSFIDQLNKERENYIKIGVLLFALVCIVYVLWLFNIINKNKYKRFAKKVELLLKNDSRIDLLEINLKKGTVLSHTNFYMIANKPIKYISLNTYLSYVQKNIEDYRQIINKNKLNNIDHFEFEHVIYKNGKKLCFKELGKCESDDLIVSLIMDITEENKEKERLLIDSQKDELTGLWNRYFYKNKILEILNSKFLGLFVFININKFKNINDKYGHLFGDEILIEFSNCLKKFDDEDVILFRVASDQFGFYKHNFKNEEDINEYIEYVKENLNLIVNIENISIDLKCRCGASIYGKDSFQLDELVEYADFALLRNNRNKNMKFKLFDINEYLWHKNSNLRMAQVKNVIKNNELSCVFQPIINLKTKTIFAVEGLSRTTNKSYSNILELINYADSINMIYELNFMMSKNIKLEFKNSQIQDIKLFINIDPCLFDNEKNIDEYIKYTEDISLDFSNVVIEITERKEIKDNIALQKFINIYRDKGAKIALDDYGAGYSNESSLIRVQPDVIKVDKMVIENIHLDKYKQILIEKLVLFGKTTETKILAEGIETKEELYKLIELGIDYGQGFYFSRPCTIEQIPYDYQHLF